MKSLHILIGIKNEMKRQTSHNLKNEQKALHIFIVCNVNSFALFQFKFMVFSYLFLC